MLRPVENAGYFNRFFRHQLNRYVGQGREYQLAPSRHTAACSTNTRKIFQPATPVIDRSGYAVGCVGVIDLDAFANTLQVFSGFGRPTDIVRRVAETA